MIKEHIFVNCYNIGDSSLINLPHIFGWKFTSHIRVSERFQFTLFSSQNVKDPDPKNI